MKSSPSLYLLIRGIRLYLPILLLYFYTKYYRPRNSAYSSRQSSVEFLPSHGPGLPVDQFLLTQ